MNNDATSAKEYDNILKIWFKKNKVLFEQNGYNEITDTNKQINFVFQHNIICNVFNIDRIQAFEYIVEGHDDGGIDCFWCDDDFNVYIIQTKYSSSFIQKGIEEAVMTKIASFITILEDSNANITIYNKNLQEKIGEFRDKFNEFKTPNYQVYIVNNGIKWGDNSNRLIDNHPNSHTKWHYLNHNDLIEYHYSPPKRNEYEISLTKSWYSNSIDNKFVKVVHGIINVKSIFELIKYFGDNIIDKNVRNYLGLDNEVNMKIVETLQKQPEYFYLLNNGITIIAEKISYNERISNDLKLKLENLSIINGGQTCNTIYQLFKDRAQEIPENCEVMIRIIEIGSDKFKQNLYQEIAIATNNQSPIIKPDLVANDEIQRKLEIELKKLGLNYRRKRTEEMQHNDITPAVLAEAVLSVKIGLFNEAKYQRRKHFDEYFYRQIFNNLSAQDASVIIKIFRYCENMRKNTKISNDKHDILKYSCSYKIGNLIYHDIKKQYQDIKQNYNKILPMIENGSMRELYDNFINLMIDYLDKYHNKNDNWNQVSYLEIKKFIFNMTIKS